MKMQRYYRQAAFLIFIILFCTAAWFTDCSVIQFWNRKEHLADIVSKMFPPDLSYLSKILAPLWATVQMSVTGTGIGSALALLAAPLCADNLKNRRLLRIILRSFIQILRSFPALILALVATFLLGLGAFAGTAAITIYTFAIMTRLTYEDIEVAPGNAWQALCTMGSSPASAYFRAIVPEIAPSYLTNALYLLETNMRHSSILGYVGAGGIGLILNEKISWLEFDKVGMILLSLFAAVCLIELLSSFLTALIQKRKTIAPFLQRSLIAALLLFFFICTLLLPPPDFSHTSTAIVVNMFSGLIHPDFAFFFRSGSGGLGYLLLKTLCISLVGTCIGTLFALPLSFFSSSRLLPPPIVFFFRGLIIAVRSVPFLIYGLIFIRVSGPGAFTGVLTLAMCSIGLLSKRFTEALDALDFRAYYALSDMGVPLFLRIRYAVVPQLLPAFISAVLYRFDVNIREASVLGLVGAGGIGAPLIFAMNQYSWHEAGAIFLGLILLVLLIDRFSAKLRAHLQ